MRRRRNERRVVEGGVTVAVVHEPRKQNQKLL